MGNKQSIHKAVSLQHTIFKNNIDFYIHGKEDGTFYISNNVVTHLTNTVNTCDIQYLLPCDSIIKIISFKNIDGELQLLAKISSSHIFNEQMNNDWSMIHKDQLVNIISLFTLQPNPSLSPL